MTFFQAATAAGASIGTAATIAEVATAATIVAEVATVAVAARALAPKVGGDFGSQVDLKLDPRGPIPYAVGRTGAAGSAVFVQTSGQDHKYLNIATVYSAAGPIDSYESFAVNDAPVAFGADGGEGASGYYLNRMWRKAQLGGAVSPYLHWTATGTKDTPANHGGMPAEWTSAHTLPGYAADLWGLQYNTATYSGGVPKKLVVAKWVKVYDPRKDSTYAGGDPAGTHRALDESTYEWSDNPYLHALTWLLGRYQNGVRLLGLGAPAAMIDVAAFVEGANVCDANGWKCGGVVYSTDDKWEVLKAFLQAGAGKPTRLGAKISCLVNTPRVSLATLKAGDVVGKVRVAGGQSRRARLNTIWPRYREEAQGWEIVTLDEPVTVEDYYDPDGGQRSTEIEYSLVQDAAQAAQLARYDIEDGRELLPIVLPCKPVWQGYKPGDCIDVDEPEYGLNGQKCLILQRRRDPLTMQVTFTLRSETDGKHPFALGQTATAPATPALTGYDPATTPTPANDSWSVVGVELTSADGTLPAIVVSGAVDSELVSGIIVEYREVIATSPATYGPWVTREFPASMTRIEITGLKPATAYQVRVRYKSVRGVEDPTDGVDLGTHTTGDIVAKGVKEIGGKTTADFVAEAEAVKAAGDALTRTALQLALQMIEQRKALIDDAFHKGGKVKRIVVDETDSFDEAEISILRRAQLMATVVDGGLAMQFNDTTLKASPTETWGQYRTGVAATLSDNTAAIVTEQTVRASADSAFASSLSALTATVGGNSAAIATEQTVRASADSALSSSLSTLSTTVGGHTASITTLQSSVNGISAQYSVVVSASTHRASIQAFAGGSLSSIIFTADAIGFSNGASDYFPFSIVGGRVKATNLEVDTLSANTVNTVHLVTGSVDTSKVGANQITGVTADEQSYGAIITSSAVTVFSSTHSTAVGGAPHAIFMSAEVGNTGANTGVLLKLYRDGVFVDQKSWVADASFTTSGSFDVIDQPGAGTHTYTITAEKTAGSGTGATLTRSSLVVMELKR